MAQSLLSELIPIEWLCVALGVLCFCTALANLFATISQRALRQECSRLLREVAVLTRSIEHHTAPEQKKAAARIDSVLSTMTETLPALVSERSGVKINIAESRIVKRLAELEPDLVGDAAARKKMEEIIQSLEQLESTVMQITQDAIAETLVAERARLERESLSTPPGAFRGEKSAVTLRSQNS